MTDVRHVRSYLVRSSRDELYLKESEVVLPTVRESAVACDNLLRAGDFTWKNFDGVCLVVLAVVCGERLLSRELSVDCAEIFLMHTVFAYRFVHQSESFGVFREYYNAAGVSVNTVAQSRRKGAFVFRVIFALVHKIRREKIDKRLFF